jgi:hypothetical protein
MAEPTKQQTVAFFAHEKAQKANKVSLPEWYKMAISLKRKTRLKTKLLFGNRIPLIMISLSYTLSTNMRVAG